MSLGEIFLRLVNLAAAGNALVLVVLLLRLILRKAPRRVICLLWAVVAVRLLLPVSIESRVSLMPSAETFPVERLFSSDRVTAEDRDGMHIDTGFDALNGDKLDEVLMPGTASMVWTRSEMLGLIWGVGAAGLLIYALVSTLRLRRRVSTAVRTEPGIGHSENVESPFVMGLLRPVVYLPFAMREEDIPSVLAHERAHIARGDHLWKPLGFLILSFYWFDPLFWLAWVLFCRDLELACDERVTRGMGLAERQSYAEALLNCAVRKNAFTAPLAFGEVGVKQRVRAIMNTKKPALWLALLSVLAVAVLAVCFLTDPVRPDPGQYAGYYYTKEVYGLDASLFKSVAAVEDGPAGMPVEDVPSSVFTVDVQPRFLITPEGKIFVWRGGTQYDPAGDFSPFRLTTESFDRLLDRQNYLIWTGGEDLAAGLREQNARAWRAEAGDMFTLLLSQRNGGLYVAQGTEGRILSIVELEPAHGTAWRFLEPQDGSGAERALKTGGTLRDRLTLTGAQSEELFSLLSRVDTWGAGDPGEVFDLALVLYDSASGRTVWLLSASASVICRRSGGSPAFARLTEGQLQEILTVLKIS